MRLIQDYPGLSDRQITDQLTGIGSAQQPINRACRALESLGLIVRDKIPGGRIGNYFAGQSSTEPVATPIESQTIPLTALLTEDELKVSLAKWLQSAGWSVNIAMGREFGIDVEAFRSGKRWIIEAKGCGSLNPMRVNYFLAILGETLQRMSDNDAKYSVALPNITQYRRLWDRLPQLAKQRTGITALFVDANKAIEEVH